MNNERLPGQSVEELLQAAVNGLTAMAEQERRFKYVQGLLLGLAVTTLERALAEGWFGNEAATAETINGTLGTHGNGWRLVRPS
jgi:hypothetical protein